MYRSAPVNTRDGMERVVPNLLGLPQRVYERQTTVRRLCEPLTGAERLAAVPAPTWPLDA